MHLNIDPDYMHALMLLPQRNVETAIGEVIRVSASKSELITTLAPVYLSASRTLKDLLGQRVIFDDPFPSPIISLPDPMIGQPLHFPYLCINLATASFSSTIPDSPSLIFQLRDTPTPSLIDGIPDETLRPPQ